MLCFFFFFFFSSRRRHTRSLCDWSSDVCSSDLACAERRVAVVPFGGGTSVVGGVEPVSDGFGGAVSIDLRRLDRVVAVDSTSLTARLEAGLTGPQIGRASCRERV